MFFMVGVTQGKKDFTFTQTILCRVCGGYGRYQVFMTYMQLLLFFIPCARWNKRYYVETTCCHTIYELNPEVGRRIARGEDVVISDADLTQVYRGSTAGKKVCRNCGYEAKEDFDYCPRCGTRLD